MKLTNTDRDYIARVYEKYTLCGKLIAYEKANTIALLFENNLDIIINEYFELKISAYLREKYNYNKFIIADYLKYYHCEYLYNSLVSKLVKIIVNDKGEK